MQQIWLTLTTQVESHGSQMQSFPASQKKILRRIINEKGGRRERTRYSPGLTLVPAVVPRARILDARVPRTPRTPPYPARAASFSRRAASTRSRSSRSRRAASSFAARSRSACSARNRSSSSFRAFSSAWRRSSARVDSS